VVLSVNFLYNFRELGTLKNVNIWFSIVGERGDSWHTFHVIIFHIFPVHVKLNIAARMASNTLGLQSDLHKFYAIRKE
jgi:hypothetical protein